MGVNVHAVGSDDEIVLVDTGMAIMRRALDRAMAEMPPIRAIVVTHCHVDHAGNAAHLAATTGAPVLIGAADRPMLEQGKALREVSASPTLLGRLATPFIRSGVGLPKTIDRFANAHPIEDGDVLEHASGLTAHAMPGHSAGQKALSWTAPDGTRVLFAGDTCMHAFGLTEPLLYEDRAAGLASIARLARLAEQADVMLFGHGKALRSPAEPMRDFARRIGAL